MSGTSIVAAPRILVYGPQSEGSGARERDANVEFIGPSWELLERLTERPMHLVICLHVPSAFEGTEVVKGIRRFDAIVPVVLVSRVQNTMLSLRTIRSQVTWSVGPAGDKSVGEVSLDPVVDASEWLEEQVA